MISNTSNSTSTSTYDLIRKGTMVDIRSMLQKHGAELCKTKWADTWMIKFNPETEMENVNINCFRALIFNEKTRDILSLGYPVQYSIKDLNSEKQTDIIKQLSNETPNQRIEAIIDGTIVYLWYHPLTQQWEISTNRKEDAHESRWVNQSYGELFDNIFPTKKKEELDKDCVYIFVLTHPDNIIVINPQQYELYHLTTYNRKTLLEVDTLINIKKPIIFQDMTIQQMIELANTNAGAVGFMVVKKVDDLVLRYRFETKAYIEAYALRKEFFTGNDIEMSIIRLMCCQDAKKMEVFWHYYPIYKHTYLEINRRIHQLAMMLYREYGMRYKQHINMFVNPIHHRMLSEIHKIYLTERKSIQLDTILKYLYTLPPEQQVKLRVALTQLQ